MARSLLAFAAHARLILVLLWAIGLYWLMIFPTAVRQRRRWRRHAAMIRDPALRAPTLAKLSDEHLLAEGAAAFAILARPRQRRRVTRFCVAFELINDYLDALTEEHPTLANNRCLHQALTVAIDPDAADDVDYYAHHPYRNDGGYLRALVADCRDELARLPAAASIAGALRRAVARAAEAQSLNHAGVHDDRAGLATWARSERAAAEEGLRWWEVAAAAGSPLGSLALVAAASDPRTTEREANAIEGAYFPWIAGLFGLLESLVDHRVDATTGNHSYVGHYASPDEAVARLGSVAERAASSLDDLRLATRHRLLLAGMVGMNLAQADATDPLTREGTRAVHAAVGGIVTPFVLMLRLRRLRR